MFLKRVATTKIDMEKLIETQKLVTMLPASILGISRYLEMTLSVGVTQKSLKNGLVNHVIFMVTFTALIRSLCKVDTKVAFSNS